MTNSLDFNKLKKSVLKITLNDKEKTKLTILPPTKALFEEVEIARQLLIALIEKTEEEVTEMEQNFDGDITSNIYEVCAKTMSRNTEEYKVTKETLEEILDFGDVIAYLSMYVNELMLQKKQKN